MKTVLVIGGNGFIGRRLTAHLASVGFDVRVVQRRPMGNVVHEYIWDGVDRARLSAIFATVRPDFVIHLISSARPSRDLDHVAEQYGNTVRPAVTVAKLLPRSTELALFFGSCEEYGDGPSPAHESQELRAISPYGWAKIAAFHGVSMITQQEGIRTCWARPYLVFGPGQAGDRLVPDVIRNCLANREIPLTLGRQSRDFVYVDDICRMVVRILLFPERASGQTINLCTGSPRFVEDVARLIQRLIGMGKLQFGALNYRSREVMEFFGSSEKFQALFGAVELTPFEAAMTATIEHYRRLVERGVVAALPKPTLTTELTSP